jgi:methionyl-tRNA formyltransferase
MMPFNIALFANHLPGLEVAKFLATQEADQVGAIYLTGENPDNDTKIIDVLRANPDRVFIGSDVIKKDSHVEWFKQQKFDAIICVYWPWLLEPQIFSSVAVTVNFHPALLPINRGWFPHVHSLIDSSKAGVTIHRIEDGADTGAIWAQKEIQILPTETAKDIYDRLQSEIVSLFKVNWEKIKKSEIQPYSQDESKAIYHAKKEIRALDLIDPDRMYRAKDLINLLRARTFGSRGFAYLQDGDEKIFLKLSLSKSSNFED